MADIGRGCLHEVFALQGDDGAGQVAPLGGAVADDHHLFQHLVVRLQDHIDLLPALEGNLLRLHSDVRKDKHRLVRSVHLQFVTSVQSGYRSDAFTAFHCHVCADGFQALVVRNLSRNRDTLRLHAQEREKTEYYTKKFSNVFHHIFLINDPSSVSPLS